MESRVCNPGFLNLSVQNALDCISENVLISKIFPGERAPETPYKSAPFAVLMALSCHIATVYYISRPPLSQNPPSAPAKPGHSTVGIFSYQPFLLVLSRDHRYSVRRAEKKIRLENLKETIFFLPRGQ